MMKLIVLLACLLGLTAAHSFSTHLKKNVRKQMAEAGHGGICETDNPCDNGDCYENDNGTASCDCYYPYGGQFCEEVCPFDQCWEDYWAQMDNFWGTDDDDDFDDGACYDKRRVMTKSPGHVRRALSMKKRSSALKKQGKKRDGDLEYEEYCRKEIAVLLECLNSSFENDEYCEVCDNGTLAWTVEVVKNENLADEYCSESYECHDQETIKCVQIIDEVLMSHYDETDDKKVETTALVAAEACITDILEDTLSLDGCPHNAWVKDELILLLIKTIKAEFSGCNMTKIDVTCGFSHAIDNYHELCPLTKDERETFFDTTMECAEAAATIDVCLKGVQDLASTKPYLLGALERECKTVGILDDLDKACQAQKRSVTLQKILKKLNKDDKKTDLLKVLLRSLLKEN